MNEERPRFDEIVTGTQSIDRAVVVLRVLAGRAREGMGLSEVVAASGLSKPTCRRILLALMEAGLAAQDEATRRYWLGPEIYVLGSIAAERYGIHRHALDCVVRLAQKTGDAAFLQMRRGPSVVCLHREDGPWPIRSHVLAAGDRHPLGVGAGPLAILAALDDDEVEASLAANADCLAKTYPMLDRALILDLVAETRERGWSLNRGLLFPGSWGMGMAVRGVHGRVEACLSLAAVESRMQGAREGELAAILAEEVGIVEQRLRDAARTGRAAPAAAEARRTGTRR